MADVKWLNAFDLLFGPFLIVRSVRLPPSPRLRRTAVALAEAGQADRDHGPAKAGHYDNYPCPGPYLTCGPMCGVDFSFSLQMNSNNSVSGIRRAFVVAV